MQNENPYSEVATSTARKRNRLSQPSITIGMHSIIRRRRTAATPISPEDLICRPRAVARGPGLQRTWNASAETWMTPQNDSP